jgi:hypothetical protein
MLDLVGGAVHGELVGVGGEPVDGGFGEQRVGHGGEPFAGRSRLVVTTVVARGDVRR